TIHSVENAFHFSERTSLGCTLFSDFASSREFETTSNYFFLFLSGRKDEKRKEFIRRVHRFESLCLISITFETTTTFPFLFFRKYHITFDHTNKKIPNVFIILSNTTHVTKKTNSNTKSRTSMSSKLLILIISTLCPNLGTL